MANVLNKPVYKNGQVVGYFSGDDVNFDQYAASLGASSTSPLPSAPAPSIPQTPTTPQPAAPAAPAPAAPPAPPPPPPSPTLNLPGITSTGGDLTSFANALSEATNLAKQKRNAAFLGNTMTPFQGTLAASDFGSILSNLNRASDTMGTDLMNRAMTAATPTFSTMQVGNDTYQVQMDQNGRMVAATKLFSAPPPQGAYTEVSAGATLFDPTTNQAVYTAPTASQQNTYTQAGAQPGTTQQIQNLPTSANAFPSIALEPGATGIEVSKLQKALGVAQTGVYDEATKQAVLALQNRLGVDNSTGPGYYGPRTMAALGVTRSTPSSSGSTATKVTWSNTQQNSLIGAGLSPNEIPRLFNLINQHGLQYVLDNSNLPPPVQTAIKAIYGIKQETTSSNPFR